MNSVIRMAERLRELIERTKFHYKDKLIEITLSIGVAAWRNGMKEPKELVMAADAMLYKSKRAGRNKVSY
jgi:diguanylate cyclase (GGDEF)-like protein